MDSLSIVSPVFNEAGNLESFIKEIREVLPELDVGETEVIFVDDSSTDNSWELIQKIARREPDILGIKFQKNAGQASALLAGLKAAKGDYVLTIDSDLQHPIKLIPSFWQLRHSAHVISGRQIERKEGYLKRTLSKLFYRILQKISGYSIESNVGDFRLFSRSALDQVLGVSEQNQVIRFTIARLGIPGIVIPFKAEARQWGKSKFTFGKMTNLAINSILATTSRPLMYSGFLSFVFGILAIILLVYAITSSILDKNIPGWTSTVAVILLGFTGVFMILAIQGAYISKLIEMSQGFPRYHIKETTFDEDND
jgi:glycosyltransferase involved in cell wall biosynthesis